MKTQVKHLLAVAGLLLAPHTFAQDTVKPAMSEKHAKAMVDYRQSVYTLLGSNMAPLGGMAKGAIEYDAQAMQTHGMRIEQLAAMLRDYLYVDTRDFEVETGAKDNLWDNYEDVTAKIDALADAARTLQQIAQKGEQDKYRQAIADVGASCKSCHDDYKKD